MRTSFSLGLLAMSMAGCGPAVERGEVEGKLHRGGKPLQDVVVTFLPNTGASQAATRASGVTDANGNFRLRTQDQRDSVVAGEYRVIVEDLANYKAPRSPDGTVLKMRSEERRVGKEGSSG